MRKNLATIPDAELTRHGELVSLGLLPELNSALPSAALVNPDSQVASAELDDDISNVAALPCSAVDACPAELTVEEINDPDLLPMLRTDWDRLLAVTPQASYFHTLDWFLSYWSHFGALQSLRVLVVQAGEEVIGIVPFVIRNEATRIGRVRILTYPLEGWGSVFGPIGGDGRRIMSAALKHVRQTRCAWDLFDLRYVDSEGGDAGATVGAIADAGMHFRRQAQNEAAMVDLRGGWDAYWSSRTTHFRTNVRRCEKKLHQQGKIAYVRYRPQGRQHNEDDPRWDLFEQCQNLAQSSWQGHSTTGTTLSHAAVRDFLRSAHEQAAIAGGVDLNLLYLNDAPVAFAYNYAWKGHVFGLRMGFDAHRARDGAGTLLHYYQLRDACERGDYLVDLGSGYNQCKRHWQTRLARIDRYTHYSKKSVKSWALRLKHWAASNRSVFRSTN